MRKSKNKAKTKKNAVATGLTAHLQELRRKHLELSKEVVSMQRCPAPDSLLVTALKKRKLQIKQDIDRLSAPPSSKTPVNDKKQGALPDASKERPSNAPPPPSDEELQAAAARTVRGAAKSGGRKLPESTTMDRVSVRAA